MAKGSHAVNGRDSAGQRLGIKVYGGQYVPAGGIIIRQRGTKYLPGRNVGIGTDDTLFSKINGTVRFKHTSKTRYQVHVDSVQVDTKVK